MHSGILGILQSLNRLSFLYVYPVGWAFFTSLSTAQRYRKHLYVCTCVHVYEIYVSHLREWNHSLTSTFSNTASWVISLWWCYFCFLFTNGYLEAPSYGTSLLCIAWRVSTVLLIFLGSSVAVVPNLFGLSSSRLPGHNPVHIHIHIHIQTHSYQCFWCFTSLSFLSPSPPLFP